jgi:hypothetical protein
MGRSVSCPPNAAHRVYVDISWMGQTEDEDRKPHWDDDLARIDFDDAIANLQAALSKRYKSVNECDAWLDRENRAVAENRHAYFGVSEYCSMLCVWVVPKDDDDGYHGWRQELSGNWCELISDSFDSIVTDVFGVGNTLHKLGTFSNGESVYQRRVVKE